MLLHKSDVYVKLNVILLCRLFRNTRDKFDFLQSYRFEGQLLFSTFINVNV
jgi:hypothetical protein